MNTTILLIAMILMWLTVAASLFQRFYKMPKWFENPPVSFELIRKQSKASKAFWLPLTALLLIFIIASLIVNWADVNIRNYIIITLAGFVINAALTGAYFVKEVMAFSKMEINAPQTPDLLKRTKFWLKWTTVRNLLQIISAWFITIAYLDAVSI